MEKILIGFGMNQHFHNLVVAMIRQLFCKGKKAQTLWQYSKSILKISVKILVLKFSKNLSYADYLRNLSIYISFNACTL